MKTPPLLLGACLLFWGWQTGIPLVGAVMALVLEGSRAMGWRWELGDDDFGRLWKLSLSLLLGDAVYAMSVSQRTDLDLYLFPWLPIVFFPMVAGQVYSTHDRIPLRAFFWPLPSWMTPEQRVRELNVTYPYFGACLLATSVSNRETLLFYAGNAVLLGWTLWTARSRRFPAPAWLALFAVIIAVGYQSSGLLSRMQKLLERRYASRIAQGTGDLIDPYESRTAIGRIGRLKLSGAITLRIDPFFSGRPPGLLRQTSYTLYNSGYWLATRPQFARVPSGAYSDKWELLPEPEDYDGVRISTRLGEGPRLMAVPHGAFELDRLPVKDLATNRLGTFRVFGGPDWVSYRARFDPGQSIDGPPGIEDLRIPRNEDAALQRIADDLGLHNLKPEEAIATVRAFFEEHFRYTTFLSLPEELSFDAASPLSRFLLELREGHCEYFASATVLLLREAGIPARYVTGYAVREYSPREQRYVVRLRDAHAWTIYYADGRWHELDTTPGSWQEVESARAAWWEPMSDYFSTLHFRFARWRAEHGMGALLSYGGALLVPLIVFGVWRFLLKKRRRRFQCPAPADESPVRPHGDDSEFYRLESQLIRCAPERRPGESPARWLARISDTPACRPLASSLFEAIQLHYRHRFDPLGLDSHERVQLARIVDGCIEQLRTTAHPRR